MTSRSGLNRLLPGAPGLALADRPQQRQLTLSEFRLEGAAEIVLVPDDHLPGMSCRDVAGGLEHAQQGLALVCLRARQGEHDRQPGQGADQVQPQTPEKYRE